MSVHFPTRPRPQEGAIGLPKRADPCQCDHGPLLIAPSPTCVTCGRFTKATIDRTWADRVAELDSRRRQPLEQDWSPRTKPLERAA